MNLLAFAGSLRKDSYNKKLIRVAAAAARAAGAQVTLLELEDYPMPPYDGDLEEREGLPDGARRLKEAMAKADAYLISTPEYNGSIPGTLKNVIDWTSRPAPDEVWSGKWVGLLSASPGGLGATRATAALRLSLAAMLVLVVPEQASLPKAHEAFNDDGSLKKPNRAVDRVVKRLLELGRKPAGA